MKTSKLSTMPRRTAGKGFKPQYEQTETFNQLITILAPYARLLRVHGHTATEYELWTEHEHRTKGLHPRRKTGFMFAGISIRKTYVGFYFYPLLINETLKETLHTCLRPALAGNSALRIGTVNHEIICALHDLLEKGWRFYMQMGWVRGKLTVDKKQLTRNAK